MLSMLRMLSRVKRADVAEPRPVTRTGAIIAGRGFDRVERVIPGSSRLDAVR
jgi:hypothetical protein